MTEEQNKLAEEIADCIYANSFHAPDGSHEPRLDSNPPAIYLLQEALAALRAEREPATEAVLMQALAFFVAVAFGDGYFDGDADKERVRAWLLKQPLREDITVQEVVESMLALKGKGASQDEDAKR